MNSVKDYIKNKMSTSSVGDEDDDKPYDSIARDGADISDNVNMESDGSSDASDSMYTSDSISMPAASPLRSPAAPAGANLMADYNKQEDEVRGVRQQNLDRNSDIGIYRALAQLAGAASTSPVQTGLYDSLTKQNDAQAAAATSDLGRRATVMKAIQQAQSKQTAVDAANARADQSVSERARHNKVMEDIQASNADSKSDKSDTKADEAKAKAYTQMRKDLESFRGNRPVQQAAMDAYSAEKALAIVKDKDPNTLTTQDLNLLANEIGKIASGGVPGEHGVQAMMPSNLQTKYAEMKNFLLSKPTDANAGAYVQKNMQYLQHMVDAAHGSIADYRRNIAKGYKNRVNPDDFNEAVSDYNFGGQSPAAAEMKARTPSGPGPGSIVNVKGKRYRVGADGDSLEPI